MFNLVQMSEPLQVNHRQAMNSETNLNSNNIYNYENNTNINDDIKASDTDYILAKDDKGKLTPYLAFCLVICSIGCSFQVGWNIGVYNTPIKVLKQFFNDTYKHEHSSYMSDSTWTGLWSLTNGLMPLGGMIGGLASGALADLFGRKRLMFMVNILVIIGCGITVMSKFIQSYVPIIFGRFITGVYCGLFTGVGPLYLAEVAPKNLRGAAGTMHQLAIVFGILLTNVMGLPEILGKVDLWPYLIGITAIPAIIHFVFLPFCCETPKYMYIKRDDAAKAEKILKSLRGAHEEDVILTEMSELAAEKQLRLTQKAVSYKDLFTNPRLRRPLVITIVIQMSQQFSGINSIAYYSTNMFISIGLNPNTWAVYATIIIDCFKVTITVICMILIEIAGRRKLLISGYVGMAFFSFCLAIIPAIGGQIEWLKYLTVAFAVAYVIAFSVGPGSIPWLITAEIFASDARGRATSVATLVNWLSNFIVTTSIPLITAQISNYIYLIFGSLIIFFIIFIYFKVPETKKKSIEEISKHFNY